MPRQKKTRGRPIKYGPPEPIPDKPENILRALFKVRPINVRRMLKLRGDKAAGVR